MTPTCIDVPRDGLRLRARDGGPRDGEPVVLLHGFPQRTTCWSRVEPLLHAEGFRTLALDQRGYCPTARPRRRRDHSLPNLVADVVGLLDAAGLATAHVVGHDWGAGVAWAVAAAHPERVRSLTAISVPHPTAFQRAMTSSDQALRSWYIAFFQLPRVPELVLSRRTEASDRAWERLGMTPEMIRDFHRDIVDDGALTGGLNWYRALPFASREEAGRPVRVPTTYVWSDRDPALGRRGADLTAEYVDAPYRFVEIPGASHWLPEHRPDEVAAAIVDRARGR